LSIEGGEYETWVPSFLLLDKRFQASSSNANSCSNLGQVDALTPIILEEDNPV